jgi:hypothetical protein
LGFFLLCFYAWVLLTVRKQLLAEEFGMCAV